MEAVLKQEAVPASSSTAARGNNRVGKNDGERFLGTYVQECKGYSRSMPESSQSHFYTCSSMSLVRSDSMSGVLQGCKHDLKNLQTLFLLIDPNDVDGSYKTSCSTRCFLEHGP